MEVVQDHPLIKLNYSIVKNTRKFYGLDVNSINEGIDAIQEWVKKQDHLVEASEYMDRNYIEKIILLAGGSIEGAKNKIDKLCTSRGLMPELCLNHNLDEYDQLLRCVNIITLPKLSPLDNTRVIVLRFISENLDDFSMLTYFRYCFLLGEYRLNFDYPLGERHVIDLKNVKLSLLGKVNPIIMKKAELLCTEGYGTKIKGIHILNAPSFVDKLVVILKTTLKDKVAKRVHVHNTYEDFHKHVPKDILPKDYDGDETSCDKIAEQWKEQLRTKEATEIIARTEKRISNEAKRVNSAKFDEEYLGMPGSFRKLNVD